MLKTIHTIAKIANRYSIVHLFGGDGIGVIIGIGVKVPC
jgi:hypothetical protein